MSVLVQEILYPEFCAALVRIADVRFSSLKGINERLRKLVTQHLLPLPETRSSAPLQSLHSNNAFTQYLQLMDPIMKITFTAAARCVMVLLFRDANLYVPCHEPSPHALYMPQNGAALSFSSS